MPFHLGTHRLSPLKLIGFPEPRTLLRSPIINSFGFYHFFQYMKRLKFSLTCAENCINRSSHYNNLSSSKAAGLRLMQIVHEPRNTVFHARFSKIYE